jgi:DNA-binding ferritin-like protein
MYDKLIASNEEVIAGLTELFMMLEENHLHGFGDFIAGRIDAHNKHQWMLQKHTEVMKIREIVYTTDQAN